MNTYQERMYLFDLPLAQILCTVVGLGLAGQRKNPIVPTSFIQKWEFVHIWR